MGIADIQGNALGSSQIIVEDIPMTTVRLWTDSEVDQVPRLKAVFDDIRATRKSEFVNNFWRGLCNQPTLLERTWANLKEVMVKPGDLDPLTKELIYMAVSTVNGCSYCVHSHTAAARAKGMSMAQHEEFLAVVGMAMQTNGIVTALQIPVDEEFKV
jgi:AhpD family alkylhydroperoxidase